MMTADQIANATPHELIAMLDDLFNSPEGVDEAYFPLIRDTFVERITADSEGFA